jgi:hypothetical protein
VLPDYIQRLASNTPGASQKCYALGYCHVGDAECNRTLSFEKG